MLLGKVSSDGRSAAGADVQRSAGGVVTVARAEYCRGNIFDEDEIAQHQAVFIKWDRLTRTREAAKQRYDPGIGIGQRLPWPVDVLQPENFQTSSQGGCPSFQDMFLRQFGGGVNADLLRRYMRLPSMHRPVPENPIPPAPVVRGARCPG